MNVNKWLKQKLPPKLCLKEAIKTDELFCQNYVGRLLWYIDKFASYSSRKPRPGMKPGTIDDAGRKLGAIGISQQLELP